MTINHEAGASVVFNEVSPDAPSITGATPGDTEVVLAIDAATESDVVYARYRTVGGSWSGESESFKRTGDGDITITGLTNETRYQFGIYAKSGVLLSPWDFISATPTASTISPLSILSKPLDYLRTTLANSGNFQTMVDAVDANAALEYIKIVRTDDMDTPWAVVDWSDNFSINQISGGARNHYMSDGSLAFILREAITESDFDDAAIAFMNHVGAILVDLAGLGGTGGYLDWTTLRQEYGPIRPKLKRRQSQTDSEDTLLGNFYEIMFLVDFRGIV